jgi:hypothetical protein
MNDNESSRSLSRASSGFAEFVVFKARSRHQTKIGLGVNGHFQHSVYASLSANGRSRILLLCTSMCSMYDLLCAPVLSNGSR